MLTDVCPSAWQERKISGIGANCLLGGSMDKICTAIAQILNSAMGDAYS